jgi:alpha-L-fucosidase 2
MSPREEQHKNEGWHGLKLILVSARKRIKPATRAATAIGAFVLAATSLVARPSPDSHTLNAGVPDATLWYQQPARQWLEAMPIGNGLMGAMVFGGIPEERIALNESSFWSGRPHDYDDPNANIYFPQIRDLVFAGRFQEAEKMADGHFWGIPKAQEAYQPIGDLLLSFGSTNGTDYRRELDLETGVAKVSYRSGDAVITRETFISWPDRVLVMHIRADRPGRISLGVRFRGPYLETSLADRDHLVMDGAWHGPFSAPASGMAGLIARTAGRGIGYEAALVARLEGGRSEAAGSTLNLTNADAVTLVLAVATSFVNYTNISGNPAATCAQILSHCAGKSYATLLQRHEADFHGLMSRVQLKIGDASQNAKPTDERLRAVRIPTSSRWPFNSAATFWLPAAAPAGRRPICRASGTRRFFLPGAANTPSTSTSR